MPDWLVNVLTMGAAAAGVYAGIRYDIGQMTAKIESHKERIGRLESHIFK